MYENFFKLKHKPFGIDQDIDQYVLTDQHKEALSSLMYTISEADGWALLIGPPGTGKTTTVLYLIQKLSKSILPVYLADPIICQDEFYRELASQLNLNIPCVTKQEVLSNIVTRYKGCTQEYKSILIIVDEAQDLSSDMLEELRLLGNVNAKYPKLLNIFLVAQDNFWDLVDHENAISLVQRIRRAIQMDPLNSQQTIAYIKNRLELAGSRQEIFSKKAFRQIYELSRGIPRVINNICDESLLLAFSRQNNKINTSLIEEAVYDNPALRWQISNLLEDRIGNMEVEQGGRDRLNISLNKSKNDGRINNIGLLYILLITFTITCILVAYYVLPGFREDFLGFWGIRYSSILLTDLA